MDRRTFCKTAATATVGGLTLATGSAAAATFEDARPDHVTLSWDQSRMAAHVPWVRDPPRQNADEEPQTWYGWIASSNEYDYDIYVYAMKYRVQRGTSALDSHRYDREPFYVYVDPSLEEVQKVVYSGYHWYAAESDGPPTIDTNDGEHPTAQIMAPYNHYTLLDTDDEAALEKIAVEPLGNADGGAFASDSQTTFSAWLDTGWRQAAEPGVFQNPIIVESRGKWWRENRETLGARIWRQTQLSMAELGIDNPELVGGAAESDLT